MEYMLAVGSFVTEGVARSFHRSSRLESQSSHDSIFIPVGNHSCAKEPRVALQP